MTLEEVDWYRAQARTRRDRYVSEPAGRAKTAAVRKRSQAKRRVALRDMKAAIVAYPPEPKPTDFDDMVEHLPLKIAYTAAFFGGEAEILTIDKYGFLIKVDTTDIFELEKVRGFLKEYLPQVRAPFGYIPVIHKKDGIGWTKPAYRFTFTGGYTLFYALLLAMCSEKFLQMCLRMYASRFMSTPGHHNTPENKYEMARLSKLMSAVKHAPIYNHHLCKDSIEDKDIHFEPLSDEFLRAVDGYAIKAAILLGAEDNLPSRLHVNAEEREVLVKELLGEFRRDLSAGYTQMRFWCRALDVAERLESAYEQYVYDTWNDHLGMYRRVEHEPVRRGRRRRTSLVVEVHAADDQDSIVSSRGSDIDRTRERRPESTQGTAGQDTLRPATRNSGRVDSAVPS